MISHGYLANPSDPYARKHVDAVNNRQWSRTPRHRRYFILIWLTWLLAVGIGSPVMATHMQDLPFWGGVALVGVFGGAMEFFIIWHVWFFTYIALDNKILSKLVAEERVIYISPDCASLLRSMLAKDEADKYAHNKYVLTVADYAILQRVMRSYDREVVDQTYTQEVIRPELAKIVKRVRTRMLEAQTAERLRLAGESSLKTIDKLAD